MSAPFSAALLAGGRSRRMGSDKAFLPIGDPPQTLWQRGIDLLASLDPAQLMLSHNADQEFPDMPGVEKVEDQRDDCGPLGGLVSCLERVENSRLLVLAVDLPFMTGEFLGAMLDSGGGMVLGDPGRYEPVVAVYTKECLEIGRRRLRDGEFAMQDFVESCVQANYLQARPIGDSERQWLRNLNRPDDLAGA